MPDQPLTDVEKTTLLNGFAKQLDDAWTKSHGAQGAQAIRDTIQKAGGIHPDNLLNMAQSMPAGQAAATLADAAFRDPNMDDRAWNEMRQRQKAESQGRIWSPGGKR